MRQIFVLALLACQAGFASYDMYLKDANKIPLYAQETNVWCGAASAQMMLEGFPGGVDHVYKQRYVWDTIQPLKTETSWYTDPDGLKNVMDKLGGDSKWAVECSKHGSARLMLSVLQNIRQTQFPVTVLVYGSDHWIVFIGATTDVDPDMAMMVTLEKVEAFDPWKAQHVLVSGTTWFQKYWYGPARTRGKWSGCFVAVKEISNLKRSQPTFNIRVKSPVTDGEVLTPDEILGKAKQHLSRLVSEKPSFAALSKLELFTPRLVTHSNGSYYLISLGNADTKLLKGALMINPYSGEWEALSQWEKENPYVTERTPNGEWFFTPSQESPSPFFPVYRFQTRNGLRYMDYEGKVSDELKKMIPGS